MNWSGGAYLQDAGGNQELDFERRRQEEIERKKHSLKGQLTTGIGGALKGIVSGGAKGALMGAIFGGGIGALPGAALGAASGGLSGSGIMSGAEQKAIGANLATTAMSHGMGSYMGGASAPQSDASGLAKAHDLFNKGKISYQDMMDYRDKIGGPRYF